MIMRFALPIFLPLSIWTWALVLFSRVWNQGAPQHETLPSSPNAMYYVGVGFSLIFIAALLQLILGLPSMLFLRRCRTVWPYVVVSGVCGFLVAFLAAVFIREPEESL